MKDHIITIGKYYGTATAGMITGIFAKTITEWVIRSGTSSTC